MHRPLHLYTIYQGNNGQLMLSKETASIQTKSSPLTPDKMVEQKDLSSPLLWKKSKSNLTVEQPLTIKNGTYQKRYFTFKDKEEASVRQKRGTLSRHNQTPYLPDG